MRWSQCLAGPSLTIKYVPNVQIQSICYSKVPLRSYLIIKVNLPMLQHLMLFSKTPIFLPLLIATKIIMVTELLRTVQRTWWWWTARLAGKPLSGEGRLVSCDHQHHRYHHDHHQHRQHIITSISITTVITRQTVRFPASLSVASGLGTWSITIPTPWRLKIASKSSAGWKRYFLVEQTSGQGGIT